MRTAISSSRSTCGTNTRTRKYRDRAPRLVDDENGKRRLIIEERGAGDPQRGFGSIGGIGARQGAVKATELKYEEGRRGGFDPHKRIPDMDLDASTPPFSIRAWGCLPAP
jgi:uncharacterized protein